MWSPHGRRQNLDDTISPRQLPHDRGDLQGVPPCTEDMHDFHDNLSGEVALSELHRVGKLGVPGGHLRPLYGGEGG